MLVLSRKVGEKIVIGGDIVVQVLAVNGGRVRIGIQAPPEVGVWREECVPLDQWGTEDEALLCGSGASMRLPQKG